MLSFIRDMLATIMEGALMPTGKNLIPTLEYAGTILGINLIAGLFGFPTVFSFGGCILAVLVLLGLLIIERSEYSEISRLYGDVELRVKDITRRKPSAGYGNKDGGPHDVFNKFENDASGGADK